MNDQESKNPGLPSGVDPIVDHAARLVAHIYVTTRSVWTIPELRIGGDKAQVWMEMGKNRVKVLVKPEHRRRLDIEATLRLLAERISTERLKAKPDNIAAVSANSLSERRKGSKSFVAMRAQEARDKAHAEMVRLQEQFDQLTEELASILPVRHEIFDIPTGTWLSTNTAERADAPSPSRSQRGRPRKQSPDQTGPNTVGSIPPTSTLETLRDSEKEDTSQEPEPEKSGENQEAIGTEIEE